MKKILSLLLALCMMLALGACGGETEAPAEATAPEAPAEAAAPAEPAPAEPAGAAVTGDSSGEASAEPAAAGDASGEASAAPPAPSQAVVRAEPVELDLPEDAVYIAFTGDVHAEIPGYEGWVMDIRDAYGDQFIMLNYSGDICEKNWVEDTYVSFMDVMNTQMPGAYNITTGNQEFKAGAPGATWDELGEGHTRIGEVTVTEDYIVYNLGSAQEAMSFPQADIDAVDAYLAAAPADIPVFILSHFPLHLSCATATHGIPGGDHRQTENNLALIEVLNKYPNVVFLWGHNHTFQDPRYGTICPAGSRFTYDYNNPTDKIEINFIYANYGSFCRGDNYGIMAEVIRTDTGVQVGLDFIDTNVSWAAKDSAVLTFSADGVTAEVTPGTGINTAEILSMSGFDTDPNFEAELRG